MPLYWSLNSGLMLDAQDGLGVFTPSDGPNTGALCLKSTPTREPNALTGWPNVLGVGHLR